MQTVPLGRAGGSTRGFATTDPERQGVFAGSTRLAPRMSLVAPASGSRAAAPQAQGGSARPGLVVVRSCAPR